MIAIKQTGKEVYNREDKQQIIYTDAQNLVQFLKFNRITLNPKSDVKNSAHVGIRYNQDADNATKETVDMPGIGTIKNFKQITI